MFFSKDMFCFFGVKENEESFENFRTIILFQHGILKINQLVDKWAFEMYHVCSSVNKQLFKEFHHGSVI
jgi:hypothetical protein